MVSLGASRDVRDAARAFFSIGIGNRMAAHHHLKATQRSVRRALHVHEAAADSLAQQSLNRQCHGRGRLPGADDIYISELVQAITPASGGEGLAVEPYVPQYGLRWIGSLQRRVQDTECFFAQR